MRKRLLPIAILAASLALVTVPAFAHHGGSVYDNEKVTTLTGTVTAFQFINPHILIFVDAKGPNGEIQHWTLEYSPPSLATHQGWKKDMVKPGDQITYEVHAAKNGAFLGRGAGKMIVNGVTVGASGAGF